MTFIQLVQRAAMRTIGTTDSVSGVLAAAHSLSMRR
jgi:hypothetical protein